MRLLVRILLAGCGTLIITAATAAPELATPMLALPASTSPATRGDSPELAYLKEVNAWRPPADPQLLFLLMGQFANAGRYDEGIKYFEGALTRFRPQLDARGRALYLTALAALRAGKASDVFLLQRIGWVHDTLAMLDEARRLTHDEAFIVRWMSGVVRVQLPAFFGERGQALRDLTWCETNAGRAPHAGWLREVYYRLAQLYREQGEVARAAAYQARSGLPAGAKPVVFTSPFAEDAIRGHTFSARAIREVVPGTVYLLSGFDFTEFAFIVSANRRELIAIDAGTTPDAARAALHALRERVPALPPLTTVLVTHAHWDHVGGRRAFRSLEPAPRFIGRANYASELARDAAADPAMLRRFFGKNFALSDVLGYHPDVTIDRPTDLVIGGTRLRLLPARGGETDDAMLVHLPDYSVLFLGDVFMPYLGAPFTEEGSLDGMLAAIDQVHAIAPRILLHGHEPLTRIFSSTAMLDALRPQLFWLRNAVGQAIRRGVERGAIQQANLVPPTLEATDARVQLAYLVLRENVINRLFDRATGYWRNGLRGLDALTDADRGDALVAYMGLSADDIAAAAERMIADGRHELAAEIIHWARSRLPRSERLEAARRHAYLKLMEKYQEFNPFKFIVYAGEIGMRAPQIERPAHPGEPSGVSR